VIFVLGYDPGSVHRYAALLCFDGKARPRTVKAWQVPETREGVRRLLQESVLLLPFGSRLSIAVETPRGVAHGAKLAGVKGKGSNLVETRAAAERFASIAWAMGFTVHEHSAGDVRAAICHDKAAKDSVVKAAIAANVDGMGENAHVNDAIAIALFVGAKLSGYSIRFTLELARAKSKVAQRAAKRKAKPRNATAKWLPASVLQRMREQGHL
jgi:hypothetical protein